MERNAHYFTVGVFVSIALVLMVAFVIWLAGTHDTRRYNNYTIYFTDSVSGLNQGVAVQYNGVQVGKVTDIRLAEGRNDLIKVDIQVSDQTPIHVSTTASLATLGVTGLVFIQLTTMAGDHELPLRIEGERYPVIKGSGSALSKLLEDVPEINKRILDITTKVNNLLTVQNTAAVGAILANVQQLTAGMNSLMANDNVANATNALQNLSDASNDFGPTIDRVKQAAGQLDETIQHMNALIAQNQGNISRFTDQGLRQVTAASVEAQKTSRSIRELSDKLKQNPSQIVYKPSYHGVEAPK